jgi:uncharacterized Zn finger protein
MIYGEYIDSSWDIVNPVCHQCGIENDVWIKERVVDAWQKDGFNNFQYNCSECGTKNIHSVQIVK